MIPRSPASVLRGLLNSRREIPCSPYLRSADSPEFRRALAELRKLASSSRKRREAVTRELKNVRVSRMISMGSPDLMDCVIGLMSSSLIRTAGYPERVPGGSMGSLLVYEDARYGLTEMARRVDPAVRMHLAMVALLGIFYTIVDNGSGANPWVTMARRLPAAYARELRDHLNAEGSEGISIRHLSVRYDYCPRESCGLNPEAGDQSIRMLVSRSLLSFGQVRAALNRRARRAGPSDS